MCLHRLVPELVPERDPSKLLELAAGVPDANRARSTGTALPGQTEGVATAPQESHFLAPQAEGPRCRGSRRPAQGCPSTEVINY